jgi:2-polyprenyl-6-methoxyphenol hydroxylase-like FAD-dependent oxidoreductase
MAGVDKSELKTVPLYGRGVHPTDGSFELQEYGRKDEFLNALSRTHLHNVLMEKVSQHKNIKIFNGCQIN